MGWRCAISHKAASAGRALHSGTGVPPVQMICIISNSQKANPHRRDAHATEELCFRCHRLRLCVTSACSASNVRHGFLLRRESVAPHTKPRPPVAFFKRNSWYQDSSLKTHGSKKGATDSESSSRQCVGKFVTRTARTSRRLAVHGTHPLDTVFTYIGNN